MTTLEELKQLAVPVREKFENSYGQCYPDSKELRKKYISKLNISPKDIEIEEVRVGKSKTIRHYVVAFPADEVENADVYGRIIIDITLDQYCDQLEKEGKVNYSIGSKENIPDINIFLTKESAPY